MMNMGQQSPTFIPTFSDQSVHLAIIKSWQQPFKDAKAATRGISFASGLLALTIGFMSVGLAY